MDKLETIQLEITGRVATVTLNRPDVRNAFHPSMIREMTEVFVQIASRSDLAVVILRGEGKSFSSGADLDYMKKMAGFGVEENLADAKKLDEMFWAIYQCPVPVIGRIQGHAMGGGVGLTAVCDIAACVSGTQFAFSEVRLGLAPAVISPYILEKMHPPVARRYMLSGEIFEAETALDAGLVDFVGDEASVNGFIAKLTKAFVENGPHAVRATKSLLRHVGAASEWKDRRHLTTKVIAELRVGSEGQEGLKAFLEKREPSWKIKGAP